MRIFISSVDASGTKRTTRLLIPTAENTNILLKQISRQMGVTRNHIIVRLKYQPINLIIVDNLPIYHYPIKNGSLFLVEVIEGYDQEEKPLEKIEQESEIQSFMTDAHTKSESDSEYTVYFETCLVSMLEAVREGQLEKVASLLKEEPEDIQDEGQLARIMTRKNNFLLNQAGQCGRNALHWAIHTCNAEIVSFLLIKGSSPTILTIDEYTPLQLAVQHRSVDILQLLLNQKRTDVNRVTAKGTALHLAVLNQDASVLQLLLTHEADPQLPDRQGHKPIDICKNDKIGKLLIKKSEMKKMSIPYIGKGMVCKVSSVMRRLKERNLLVNPFKNELTVSTLEGQVQQRWRLQTLTEIEKVVEQSWLMSDKMSYFSLSVKHKQKPLLLAVKHDNICRRWVQSIRNAKQYLQYAVFNKPVKPSQQVIQLFNDEKNTTTLYKRKVNLINDTPKRTSSSIMNLKPQNDFEAFSRQYQQQHNYKQPGSNSTIPSDSNYRESQIVLGSVYYASPRPQSAQSINLNPTPFSAPTLPKQEPTYFQVQLEEEQEAQEKVAEGLSSNNFKKNPSQKVETVSQFKMQQKKSLSPNDFDIERELGSGSFGKVYLATHKRTQTQYALKVLNKTRLIKKKQLKYAVGQAKILKKVDCPFIVRMYYAFQTPLHLYMALDNCSHGDLAELITIRQHLSQSTARFIIAQLILALQYLHSHQILYRDLKPQNILIASDGYIRLTDFGLSKENNFSMSFCGSPAYLSPEMLQKKGVGFSSDIYGVGCVLYEMVAGQPPFFDDNMDRLFQNIKAGKLRYPAHLSIQIRALLSRLLQRDINKRIGVKDINEIKHHQFFKQLSWDSVANKRYKAPAEVYPEQEQYLSGVELQRKTIGLGEYGYEEGGGVMMNHVKNFTFVRQEMNLTMPKKGSLLPQ